MKAKNSDWYKHGWSLDIKNQSWVEDTENQVDFIIKTLQLTGKERILDLACGYGRHYGKEASFKELQLLVYSEKH